MLTCIVLAGPVHATSAIMPVKMKIIHCPKVSISQACYNDQRCCKFIKTEINASGWQKKSLKKPKSGFPLYNYERDGFTDLAIEDGLNVYIE